MLDNLELVADGDLERLSELCGVEVDEIANMVREIRGLNPKPGQDFQTEVIQEVVPDVYVRRRTDGGWSVDLNTEALPKVLVDMAYHTDIAGRAKSREDKTYITEQLHAANWLVKSLDQRARTILRVATELVRQQETFLVLGVEYLRPLNLRDIAAAIDMHESTVSRVTANKFIATQRGIYPMKYFFTAAIASSGGGQAHAAEAVRHRIRQLVEGRDARMGAFGRQHRRGRYRAPTSISRGAPSPSIAIPCAFPRVERRRRGCAARASEKRRPPERRGAQGETENWGSATRDGECRRRPRTA